MKDLEKIIEEAANKHTEAKSAPLVIDDNSRKLFTCDPLEALWGHQHLYITLPQSDLEISKIKEGDWCLFQLYNKSIPELVRITYKFGNQLTYRGAKGDKGEEALQYFEKIIASTDSSLNIEYVNGNSVWGVKLPTIPEQFISYFIDQWNKGNVIKEVEVELEEDGDNLCDCYYTKFCKSTQLPKGIKCRDIKHWKLKLNQNNEISIIISEEKKYSKEELKPLFLKLSHDTIDYMEGICDALDIDEWIEENLK